MKNTLITISFLFLLPILAIGSPKEYMFEPSVFYQYNDQSYADTHTWGARFKYYWNPITYSDEYPNAEAAFINRLSFVDIGYIGSTSEEEYLDIDLSGIHLSTRYAAKDSKHVFNAFYQWSTVDLGFIEDTNTHEFRLGYGYYFMNNLLIQADFGASFHDFGTDTYIYGVNGKYLWSLNNDNWLLFDASYIYHDTENRFGLNQNAHEIKANIDYYFNVKTSFQIGGGVTFIETERRVFIDDSIIDGHTFISRTVSRVSSNRSDQEFASVKLQHYFSDQFNVMISARNNFFNLTDAQVYSFAAYFRF